MEESGYMVGAVVFSDAIYFYVYYLIGKQNNEQTNYVSVIKIKGMNLNPFTFNVTNEHQFVYINQKSGMLKVYDINNFRMKNNDQYLSKLNNDPKSSLYLVELDGEKVKDERNSIDIQEGTFQMT